MFKSNEKLYTMAEAAKIANVKPYIISYARKRGRIQNVKELEPQIRFTADEVNNYKKWVEETKAKSRTIDFNLNENYKFLPTSPRVHKFFGNPKKFKSSIFFAIGENGTIINCNQMRRIRPCLTGNGHFQINLRNGYQPEVHSLVGIMHCDDF